jgi:hypothetical protein
MIPRVMDYGIQSIPGLVDSHSAQLAASLVEDFSVTTYQEK